MDFFQELLRCPQIQGAQKPKVKRSNLSVGQQKDDRSTKSERSQ